METTTTKDNEVVVKANSFQNKAIAIILENKNEVDCIILTLYNRIMQICKEKGLTVYHQVDLALFWYINTVGYWKRLSFAYFMYSTTLSYFYQTVGCTNILSFGLYDVSSCLSIYYHVTVEYK